VEDGYFPRHTTPAGEKRAAFGAAPEQDAEGPHAVRIAVVLGSCAERPRRPDGGAQKRASDNDRAAAFESPATERRLLLWALRRASS
jgi:hypothetical protein